MKTNKLLLVSFIFLLTLLLATPVFGGGWAVITLDHLPADVIAGQPVEIRFMVRQHGQTPMADLKPKIEASLAGSTESIRVDAYPTKKTGQYMAEATFPKAGTWNWHIRAFTMEQPMPQLRVQEPAVVKSKLAISTPALIPNLWLAGLGLLGIAAASVLIIRKNHRWAIGSLVAVLLFTGGGFAITQSLTLAAWQAPDQAPEAVVETKSMSDQSLAQYGEDLFLAKGCVTCHVHSTVTAKYDVFTGVGGGPFGDPPNLTVYKASPEYLQLWLVDPGKAKPGTQMPNLELSKDEIEALIAFLLE